MTKFLLPALAIAAAIGGGSWWFMTQGAQNPVASANTVVGERSQIHSLDFPLGNPDAPVVVVEFSSLTCPHCATFNQGAFRQIKERFIDTDQILYLKREVYFDRFGLWAGMVARCGGAERYHGIVDLIYQSQSNWIGSGDPMVVAENLRRLGRQAGMSAEQVDACLNDADKALELTEFYQANAERYGIRSTPSFVINGQLFTNMPFAEFERILTEKLGS